MEKNKIFKLVAVGILVSFLLTSAAHAGYKLYFLEESNDAINEQKEVNLASYTGGRDYSTWEDNFNDASKIDPSPPGQGKTQDYLLEDGEVSMKNTYAAWTDSDWTVMKPITLTNSGSSYSICLLKLQIDKDPDMQNNYDDLRFKHEEDPDEYLDYYIVDNTEDPATVWVEMAEIPSGSSTLYMFYGNPSATSDSDIGIFSNWNKAQGSDIKITNHLATEGTWDPDVCYGDGEFLVAWEEGKVTPIQQEIRGRCYYNTGTSAVDEFPIYEGSGFNYHNENPSSAFDGTNYLVTWHRRPNPITDPYNYNIHGAFVTQSGSAYTDFVISGEDELQMDPCITFNTDDDQYFVTWEDFRNGNDHNIYAKRYSTNTGGSQVGSEIAVCTDSGHQSEPWVAYDDVNNQYMVVFEESPTVANGPFSIYYQLFQADGTKIGSKTLVASGSSVDNLFPCVEFNSDAEVYMVSWNEADMPGTRYGDIKGKILDDDGSTLVDIFTIDAGDYIRTDIVPYNENSFFVAYSKPDSLSNCEVLGKYIHSDGSILTSPAIQLSDTNSAPADWVSMDVDEYGKIFVSWEDARDNGASKPDVYGNVWWLVFAGDDVSYSAGSEIDLILESYVTSIEIVPTDFNIWHVFNAVYYDDTITFNILDGSSGSILLSDVTPGSNIHNLGVTASTIRLMAELTRDNPSTTPKLDAWSVQWALNEPPNTPSNPDPYDGETDVDVDSDLSWVGGDPNPSDTVTYDVYFGTTSPPPQVVSGQSGTTYSPGTMDYGTTYYWQIIAWDNHGASTTGPEWDFTTENDPPYTPSSPDPYDGETDVDVDSDLSWAGGDPNPGDTVTYDVYLEANDPTPDVLVSDGQSGTTYDPGTLDANTQYYWQIIAEDNHGATTTGPVWDFTTENNPPYTPSNPDPYDGETGVDVDHDLSWTGGDPDPGDTVTYDVYFEAGDPTPDVLVSDGQSGTTYDPGTMTYGLTYYWQIIAEDNHGATATGPVWDFSTAMNTAPYTPSNPDPYDGETDVDVDSDLSFNGGDPNSGDTVTYDVYLDTVDPPVTYETIGPYPASQTSITYDPGTLTGDTTYYWQIIAWDDHGAQSTGSVWEFTTEYIANNPPYTPYDPDPSNHETDVDIDYDLGWSGGDPDPGDTVTYDVYFGTTSPPGMVVNNQSATNFDPGTLNTGTKYYWKIVAWDNHGAWAASPIWDFTTENDPPYMPSNPDPYDGETGVDVDHDLSWTGGDPNPGDTVTYDVYFGTTSPPPEVSSGQSSTTYDPGTMDYHTTYYWKIIAEDNHGATSTGPEWDFTTENRDPNTPSNPDPYDGETDVDVNHDLSWTCDDPDGDTLHYDIYFGDYSPPPKVEEDWTTTTYDPGSLQGSTVYYWQILAQDDYGGSTNGPIWDFTTEDVANNPPYKPSDPDPYDGETDVGTNIVFSWTGGDPDPGDTVTYDVYFGDYSPPPKVEEDLTTTTYDPGTMAYNTEYFWKIVAWDNNGAYTNGDIWSFTTTDQENHAPDKPDIIPPDGLIPGVIILKAGEDYEFTFQAYDSDNDDIKYIVDWGDGNVEETEFDQSGKAKSLTHSWTQQSILDQITIKVKAEDINGLQGSSASLTFLVIKNRAHSRPTPLINFLHNHPNMFPLFQRILEILGI